MSGTWDEVQELFDQAMEIPERERIAFVSRSPAPEEVRTEVLALLEAAQGMGDFLESSPEELSGDVLRSLAARGEDVTGQTFGAFRAVRLIGSGGTSQVYLGEREDPAFEQRVALKVFSPGRDPEDVAARFASERTMLAALTHPDLARLYDAGVSENGAPFLVVELIDGVPITEYAAAQRLELDDLVTLFLRVADAVAYAHRMLVVHRDLKPSNIFVTSDGHVKLLDFGIATLTTDDDEGSARWLTPAYAAPEQLRGDSVTTSTDVHALGLLLHELVFGAIPTREDGVVRMDAIGATSRLPRHDDLEAILRHALDEDAEARYPTAAALASDVRRWSEGRPVEARPPTPHYLATRFVGRNRAPVAAAATILLMLAGGAAALSIERSATLRERDRANAAAEAAEREADKAQAIVAFLGEVFRGRDPSVAPSDTVTALQLIEWGEARIESEFSDRPEVAVELLEILGQAYGNLGLEEQTRALHGRSVALRRTTFGDESAETAAGLAALARDLQGFREFEAALEILPEAMATTQAVHGASSWEAASVYHLVANSLRELGQADSAIVLMERVVEIGSGLAASEDVSLDAISLNLAYMLRGVGRLDEAEARYRAGIPGLRADASPIELAPHLNNLAYLLRLNGDFLGADTLYREAFETHVEFNGRAHPTTLLLAQNLAFVWVQVGRGEEAAVLLEESVAAATEQFGDAHWRVGNAWSSLGFARLRSGQLEEARQPLRECASRYDSGLGVDHPWSVFARAHVDAVDVALGHLNDPQDLTLADGYAAYWASESIRTNEELVVRMVGLLEELGLTEWAARFEGYLPAEATRN